MKMDISHNRTIAEVQGDFSNVFPYLRLEFMASYLVTPRQNGETNKFAGGSTHIGDLNKNIAASVIDISATTTVNELESTFMDKLGLRVRVLRKSGPIWMETSITGMWTLQQQNNHGREISVPNAIG